MHRPDHRDAAALDPGGKCSVSEFWQSKREEEARVKYKWFYFPFYQIYIWSRNQCLSQLSYSIKWPMSQFLRSFPLSSKQAVFLKWQWRGHGFPLTIGQYAMQSDWCLWFHPKALGGIAGQIFMESGAKFFQLLALG